MTNRPPGFKLSFAKDSLGFQTSAGLFFVVLWVVLYEKSGHQRTSEDKIITELLKVKKIAFLLLTFLDQVIRIGLALGDKEC